MEGSYQITRLGFGTVMDGGGDYTRRVSLREDFECGIQELTDRICKRMRIGTNEDRIRSEEIIMVDHTPTGIVDSIIVAEAIIGNRTPASIVDIGAPGSMAR